MSSFKIIIIGSGLAGSLLASGLLRSDINVTVYERLSKDAKREGYQIRLGEDALKGFRACLDREHIDTIVAKFGRANGSRSAAPICYDRNFNVVLDATKFPTYNKSAPIDRRVLRDALVQAMDHADCLVSGKQFERYTIMDPGLDTERVKVHFTDGTSDDCDLLIGADGSHSKINQQVGLNNIHQITSHISMIAKCELPTSRYQSLNRALREFPILTYADKMCMYFCAYLPDEKPGSKQSKSNVFDTDLSSCMFGIHIPTEACPPDLAQMSCERQWEFISASLTEWTPQYHEILSLLKGSPLYVYKARASKRPSKSWRSIARSAGTIEQGHPRVWLLGDAMHAMLPARGMGGNSAIRDTATMLPLLEELTHSAKEGEPVRTAQITEKLKQYEAEMMPRAFGWVEKSGGTNIMPLDTSKWTGKLFFFLAAQAMNLAFLFYSVISFFSRKEVDMDAPELKT